MSSSTTKFSSEGFDVDAVVAAGENAVLEVGGGVTIETNGNDSPVAKAEQLKQQGNELFKEGNYLDAYDCYTDAMEACPGMTGKELLEKEAEFIETEREKAYEKFRELDEARRQEQKEKGATTSTLRPSDSSQQPLPPFVAPPHLYGQELATYHCNRAACCLHLQRNEDAVRDCHVAILLQPKYVKAYMRRLVALERLEKYDDALADAQKLVELDPCPKNRKTLQRITNLHEEQLEKLKKETMGQLKELGNSLLGNFGLSLDNFEAKKDPNTGSYSISFNQNK